MLRMFGKFELIRPLGRGAMGEVYLAKDPALGRELAIKTIRKEVVLTPSARERFAREARAAGTLNHPNVVTVYEFGEVDETSFIAMEYIQGDDLNALLHSKALTPAEILVVLAQVCDGLGHAHEQGILHRDIKPSNIRVSRMQGRLLAKILDFGIARLDGSDMTNPDGLIGTCSYMAPEYVMNGELTPRTDLFAVGVILYEALSGARLYHAKAKESVLFKIVHEDPGVLDPGCFKGVSPHLQRIAKKALAKEPDGRFQSGAELASALRSALDPRWEAGFQDCTTHTARHVDQPMTQDPQWAQTVVGKGPVTLRATAAEPRRLPLGWLTTVALAGLVIGIWATRSWWRPTSKAPPSLEGSAGIAQPPAGDLSIGRPPAPPPGPLEEGPDPGRPQPPPEQGARNAGPGQPEPGPGSRPMAGKGEAADLDGCADLAPFQILESAGRVLALRPGEPRAHALKLVALYRLGRYQDMAAVFAGAAQFGIEGSKLRPEPAYAAMETEELKARRIHETTRAALPAPLGTAAMAPEVPGGARK